MSAQQQRYRVIERIAAGGMAEVFRAESAGVEGFKKRVAIKRVLPSLAGKKEFIGMFLDEARLSAHLSHSNCVQVFDIGQGDDTYFIVMELVDGADLKGVMSHRSKTGGVIPVEEAVLICVRICEGLAYAHELRDDRGVPRNIVHRDMSPPNVLMTRYGEVKIADFGLAKANSQLEDSQPGIIKGKFGYLSPEAAQGKAVDARTDIFAVGIILWEMLAGRRLFQGKTDLETVKQVQKAQIPDLRQFNPGVPDSVLRVLQRALAGDPNQRYQTARALGDDLNNVLFALPRPVSSFDIAQLVQAVQAQQLVDQKQRAASGSLIGSLIDQALFQFTSLDSGTGSAERISSSISGRQSLLTPGPTNLLDSEPLDWGDSLGLSHAPPATARDEDALELGNLSALEDERRGSHHDLEPLSGPVSSSQFPVSSDLPAPMPPNRSKSGLLGFIVLLFILGALGGAYFSGAIPLSVWSLNPL
jgi:serine/threonine-protein kinase